MVSLSEMQMFEPKSRPAFVIPTYSAREAGNMDLSYQLEMTVNASVPTPAKRDKLLTFVKKELGYESCDIDFQNNTVHVGNLGGINTSRVLNFIQTRIDKNATEQRME